MPLGVLDVTSQFSQGCVDRMSLLEVCTDLDDPSVEEEFESALGKVMMREAGGTSRIVLYMLVLGGPVLHLVLLDLFRRDWREGCVLDDFDGLKEVI